MYKKSTFFNLVKGAGSVLDVSGGHINTDFLNRSVHTDWGNVGKHMHKAVNAMKSFNSEKI